MNLRGERIERGDEQVRKKIMGVVSDASGTEIREKEYVRENAPCH